MGQVNDIYEFVDEWQAGHYSKKILIEGDSWVSHPFPGVFNLSSQIEQFNSNEYLLLNISEPGDEASSIFKARGKQMRRLKKLESSYPKFLVVDTRKVLLKKSIPDLTYWFDEIHPNTLGFKKLAKHIRKEAMNTGLWLL